MNSGSVKKSVIIDSDLEKVWLKISKIIKLDWLEGQKSTKFLGEKKELTIRRIKISNLTTRIF